MSDIGITWNRKAMEGIISFNLTANDLVADNGLYTAVLISLFTDARAHDDDDLPGVLELGDFPDRRGWWGDGTSEKENDSVGSRLWLLERAKKTEENLRKTEKYVKEALQWLLDEGIASKIDVKAEMGSLNFSVDILRMSGNLVSYKFQDIWDGSRYDVAPIETPPLSFCVVGSDFGGDANIKTSPDSIIWTERSNTKAIDLNGIAWSFELNLFCAVGDADGADAYILTSPDGINWIERANPKNINLYAIAWSPALNLFCAVGYADGADAYIVTSPDGINWTERGNPKSFLLRGIIWSPELGLFCAVGANDGVDAYIITSPDGINWTERVNPKNIYLRAITWSPWLSLFCAVGSATDAIDAYIITSPNGIDWTERTNPKAITLQGITWGNELFCAGGLTSGADAYIVTSSNGIDWTERTSPSVGAVNDFVWSPKFNLFVGVGNNNIIASSNGIDWVARTRPPFFISNAIICKF